MDKFRDRDSAALEFNARVLGEGMDPSNPLMERLKFVGIVSSNLDEFFMVRVASLKASKAALDPVREKARTLMERMNRYFMETIVPELEQAELVRTQPDTVTPFQLDYLQNYVMKQV